MATEFSYNFQGTSLFSDQNFQIHLSANTALSVSIPGTSVVKYKVTFGVSSSSKIFARLNATAAIPAANTSASNAYEELITNNAENGDRYVNGGNTLSFISPAEDYLSIRLIRLPAGQ